MKRSVSVKTNLWKEAPDTPEAAGGARRFVRISVCLLTAFLLLFSIFSRNVPAARAEAPAVGDFITFGHYEQDNNPENGAEPIEWRVLATGGDKIFVVSKYILDIAPYHNEYLTAGITWEKCSLRAFMNGDFYNAAFTGPEKSAILLTDVQNDDNPHGTPGGAATQDYLFALSARELSLYTEYHCIYDEEGGEYIHPDRMAYYTPYAEAKGGTKWDGYETGFYWLRTPGDVPGDAANISCHGYGVAEDLSYTSSHYVTCATYGVRPAMYLSLEKLYAPEDPADESPAPATQDPDQTAMPEQTATPEQPAFPTAPGVTDRPAASTPETGNTEIRENSWSEVLQLDRPTVVLMVVLVLVSASILYWCLVQLRRK